jgi:hypothetical protein
LLRPCATEITLRGFTLTTELDRSGRPGNKVHSWHQKNEPAGGSIDKSALWFLFKIVRKISYHFLKKF